MGDPRVTPELVDAVGALGLQPRERRWTSVTYCVLDAIWSISLNYDRHVVPAVRRVAEKAGDREPVIAIHQPLPADALPLTNFRRSYPDAQVLVPATSAHRTSTRSGILKADAALRYADVLRASGIDTLSDARTVLDDIHRAETLSAELRKIPGDGVRTDYFWMLVGDDDRVKPDRMVLRYLKRHGVATDVAGAKRILTDLADQLSTAERRVSPWMVDHAIWRAERSR
jgi:hypothetical protein